MLNHLRLQQAGQHTNFGNKWQLHPYFFLVSVPGFELFFSKFDIILSMHLLLLLLQSHSPASPQNRITNYT